MSKTKTIGIKYEKIAKKFLKNKGFDLTDYYNKTALLPLLVEFLQSKELVGPDDFIYIER